MQCISSLGTLESKRGLQEVVKVIAGSIVFFESLRDLWFSMVLDTCVFALVFLHLRALFIIARGKQLLRINTEVSNLSDTCVNH